MNRLDSLRVHSTLLREAKSLGVLTSPDMAGVEIRQAIHTRQRELLELRGFVPKAILKLSDRTVEITKIDIQGGRNPKITVHYWIISPWTNSNNRGRANHRSAKEILAKAEVIQSAS